MKKVLIIVGIIVLVAAAVLGVLTVSHGKQADAYRAMLVGQTATGSEEDDSGFSYAHSAGTLDPYTIYYLYEDACEVTFHEDGTASWKHSIDKTVLAYPEMLEEVPENTHVEESGTHESFDVKVGLTGKVKLYLDGSSYDMYIDEEGRPFCIYDYKTVDMYLW